MPDADVSPAATPSAEPECSGPGSAAAPSGAGHTPVSVAAAYRAGKLRDFFEQALPAGPLDAQAVSGPSPDWSADRRQALVAALRAYHVHLGLLTPATEAALERLAHPQAGVVVAGQQAGLLTGPAYSVHKGADAVLLARRLDTDERPAVAVYWVASQDHDADEVAGVTLLDMEEQLRRLVLDLPAGMPVGRVPWQPQWTEQVTAFLAEFSAPQPHKDAALARVRRAVQPLADGAAPGWADVFARLIHGLLGQHGLLLLDPLFPPLAALMAPSIARELRDPLAGPAHIEAAAEQLLALGLTPQLRRPAGATNLFLELDSGERRLLRQEADGVFVAGSDEQTAERWTLADLEALLAADPARITPAAGLRPAVQDSLLPTLALVLGDGEIGYLAQLRGVYGLHGIRQPLVWPRLSVTWLEPNVARLLRRFGASAAQVQADPAGVLGRALAAEQEVTATSRARLAALSREWADLSRELGALDPTLTPGSERARDYAERHLAALQDRALAALARREDTRSGQLTRLERHLLPLGHPQERELSFLTYLLKHGDLVLDLLMALDPGTRNEVEIP